MNALFKNIMLNTDSYKHSHFLQYPDNTEVVYSYIESRGGKYDKTVFFGLQAFIKEYLLTPITMEQVEVAKQIVEAHGEPFNYEGWKYIVEAHGGRLPIEIKAVPEGTVVENRNILVSISNTDPKCFWLPSFLETALLRAVWYPTSTATISHHCRKVIKKWLDQTGDPAGLPFKLHDFGARGVSSLESAALGGLGHLATGAMGTDTISALIAAKLYYNEPMAGFSIPAAEHSTMTIKGRKGEAEQMERMVTKFSGPGRIYACVSDSYDIYGAARNYWGDKLKDLVITSGGTLVVRPDSGDPATVVLKVIQILDSAYGSTKNAKGFKVLHPSVRVIQGDGINEQSIETILMVLAGHGYSADNIAFGMGGALLQHVDRDTNKWAMKCSAAKIDGEWVEVYKQPITDSGKNSKKGRLILVERENGVFETHQYFDCLPEDDALKVVFRDGVLLKEETLAAIRERATKALN